MNLTLHQFQKDCVRLRLPIGLWLLLVLLQAALIILGVAEPGADLTLQIIFKVLNNLVPILQMILPLVLVPLLIHEEPLVGTTAFWFTRPIDGMKLFKSKMLFITLILILPPFLTELFILAIHGASMDELFLAVPEILLEQLKFLAYVTVLAALTQTFARFALVGASLFIGYYIVGFIVMVVFWYLGTPSFLKGFDKAHLSDSRYVVSTLAIIAISGALLAKQYRTRDSRRACITAGIALTLSFLINQFWNWDFLGRRHEKREAKIDTAAVNVDIPTDPRVRRVSDAMRYGPKDEAKKWISGPLHISGLPAGHVAEPTNIESTLTLPDGKVIKHQDHIFGDFATKWNSSTVQQMLGTTRILNLEKERALTPTLLSVNDDLFGKYATIPGKFSAEVEFVVKRYEAVANIPIKPKARYDRGSEHAVITHVLKQTGGSTILLRESKISLFFIEQRHGWEAYIDLFMRPTIYILRNDKRSEALWPHETPGPGFDFFDPLFQKRLRTVPLALRYSALTDQGHKLTEINDGWLADAELVRVQAKEVGRFTKRVQVDGFIMGMQ